jgi:hypothetical protein
MKCITIVTGYLNNYLDNIDRYPENNDELIEAISFLNNKCIEDFHAYLATKFPGANLMKEPPSPTNEMIIISEQEKNRLINESLQIEKPKLQDDFLSYLTNPMIQDLNQETTCTKRGKFDKILDRDDVKKLIENITTKKSDKFIEDMLVDTVIAKPELDLDNLDSETIIQMNKRLEEILRQKNILLSQNKLDEVDVLNKEKDKLIQAAKKYKEKFTEISKSNKSKLSQLSTSHEAKNDNSELLNLEFDPRIDYMDQKKIEIDYKSDKKIVDIILVSYYLPSNPNNITRFNNSFKIYFNERMNYLAIPEGIYEIDLLLEYVVNQLNFLEMSIDDKKRVVISNKIDIAFDLMIDEDSVFKVLGFIDKEQNYKGKKSYVGFVPYNLDIKPSIKFSFSGTTMTPIDLELDKNVEYNKSIKKYRSGTFIRKFKLDLLNNKGQYYDFIEPFRMCFEIIFDHKSG